MSSMKSAAHSASASFSPLVLAFATCLLALPGTAVAQSTANNDKVAAQALFEDARQLAAAAKYAEACPKFADSERLDPSPSTLLNLASCWEKLGRTATAWATYREAESAASAARRPDYVAVAERHAAALAPTLARLTIAVSESVDGMQVKRDGVPVGAAAWGTALPVDVGSHTVEAGAPAHKGWNMSVEVPRDGAQVTVTVPPLEPLPPEHASAAVPTSTVAPSPAASPTLAEPRPHGSTQRVAGLVIAGAGVVGLGVSGILALVANGKKQDSLSGNHCPSSSPNQCDSTGVSLRNQALSLGDGATVAFAIGAVALVTGGVLWLSAPREGSSAPAVARVGLAPAAGGAVLVGSWQ
jgi:hypothetical protein